MQSIILINDNDDGNIMPLIYIRNDLYDAIVRKFVDEEAKDVVNRFVAEKLKEGEE